MDIKKLNKQLQTLLRRIITSYKNDKSSDASLSDAETIKDAEDRIAHNVSNLELCVQYLLFDLDATRRERNLLQKRLDSKS